MIQEVMAIQRFLLLLTSSEICEYFFLRLKLSKYSKLVGRESAENGRKPFMGEHCCVYQFEERDRYLGHQENL